MGELENLQKELEELERKEKAKKEFLEDIKKRNQERAKIKKRLFELKHKKTTKVAKGLYKTAKVTGRVLGALGNKMTQPSQTQQQPVRRVVRRAPTRRVVRKSRSVSRTKRKPVKRQMSDMDWYMRM